jgi:hypothetical protein
MTPQKLTLQTRRPSKDYSDPGAVEIGYWTVVGKRVYLCNEKGTKTGSSRVLTEGQDPKLVATALLRGKISVRKPDFSRRLNYPRLGWL